MKSLLLTAMRNDICVTAPIFNLLLNNFNQNTILDDLHAFVLLFFNFFLLDPDPDPQP